jgi:Tol biopolymer transport system component
MRPLRLDTHRLVETSGTPHWRPIGISLVLAASSLALAISPAAAAYPGATNGLLAFGMKDAAGSGQIYTALADGSGATPLTTGASTHLCAAYSADGSKIAYCSDESGTFEIWTMNGDGTDQKQLTKLGGFATFPDYAPDGTTVAFGGTQAPDTHNEILTVDAATGASVTALTSCSGGKPGCSNDFPVWSPDGTQIVWIHTDDADADGNATSSQVWVMDADGSNAHALTTDAPLKGQLPDWSPDGTQIAYASGADGSGSLWVMNADGSDPHQLAGCVATDPAPCATGEEIGPTWSPDGKLIAFLHIPVGATTDRPIMVMNADGSNVHRLTADPSFQYVPAWEPVGVASEPNPATSSSSAP